MVICDILHSVKRKINHEFQETSHSYHQATYTRSLSLRIPMYIHEHLNSLVKLR